jgi:hypothetical protein
MTTERKPFPGRPAAPPNPTMQALRAMEQQEQKIARKAAVKAEKKAAPPAPKRGRCPNKKKDERCCLPAGHSGAHAYLAAPKAAT